MPDQLQLRGGTTTEHNSFTGALREVTVDTTKKTLVVHDGSSAGGTALMKESGGNAASSVGIGTGGNNAINIDSSQRVGIGTASFSNTNSFMDDLVIENTASGSGAGISIIANATNGYSNIALGDTADKDVGRIQYNHSTNHMDFHTNGTGTKVTIDDTGKVGIGTSSPTNKLHVVGDVEFTLGSELFDVMSTGSGSKHTIRLLNADASAGNEVGIQFGPANNVVGASIQGIAESDFTSTANRDGGLGFTTRLNGTLAERMRIDSSGRLLLGTTTEGEASADDLTIATSGHTGITIRSGTTSFGSLFFSDGTSGTDEYKGSVEYNHNGDYLVLRTAATEKLRIDSSGKVGIGTTSPDGELDLGSSTTGRKLTFNGYSNLFSEHSSGALWVASNFYGNASASGFKASATGNFGAAAVSVNATGGSSNSGIIEFFTDTNASKNAGDAFTPTERMRIDSSGNVGIGTSSPSTTLHLDSGGTPTTIKLDSDTEASIDFNDHGGSASRYKIGTNISDNNGQFEIRDVTNSASRMRIDANGRVQLNTTTVDGILTIKNTNLTTHTLLSLFDDGGTGTHTQIAFNNTNGAVGTINTSGSSTSYNTSSDYRLKENSIAISDGITRLKTLKPYRFNFKADASTTVDGFFAHEVTAVPEAITGTKDEIDSDNNPVYQGIDQSKLVPLLVAAVQELIGKVEALEAA